MIKLPLGGTEFTHGIFQDAVQQFPDVFEDVEIEEDPRAFKKRFLKQHGDFFVRFEAARATAGDRGVEVARWVHDQIVARQIYQTEDGAVPLLEHMTGNADPSRLEAIDFNRGTTPPPHLMGIPVRGYKMEWAYRYGLPFSNHPGNHTLHEAREAELAVLLDAYRSDNKINRAAAEDLFWCARQEALDLSGQLFVIMGAGAETGPTKHLLAAGATVLWIDNQGPSQFLDLWNVGRGHLVYPRPGEGQSNLLSEPLRIAATIKRFVENYGQGSKAHLINVAYADRIACELAVAQNLITKQVADVIDSVTLYLSPTIPTEVDGEDVSDASAFHTVDGRSWAWSIVPLQGVLYQLAQYGVKLLGGIAMASGQDLFEVTMGTANIAETETLKNRIEFALAFAGAPAIGAETFHPETASSIQAHQIMHDRLNGHRAPWNQLSRDERIQRALARKVHGNILTLGGILEENITRAALKGLKHRPDLVAKELGGQVQKLFRLKRRS